MALRCISSVPPPIRSPGGKKEPLPPRLGLDPRLPRPSCRPVADSSHPGVGAVAGMVTVHELGHRAAPRDTGCGRPPLLGSGPAPSRVCRRRPEPAAPVVPCHVPGPASPSVSTGAPSGRWFLHRSPLSRWPAWCGAPARAPPPMSPISDASGTNTWLRNTSLKWYAPDICRRGRTSTPGSDMSRMRQDNPPKPRHISIGPGYQQGEVTRAGSGCPDLLARDIPPPWHAAGRWS